MLADEVLAADGRWDAGEAAWIVGQMATGPADEDQLLDMAGLAGAVTTWDMPRACRLVVANGWHQLWTTEDVTFWLPRRARHLAPWVPGELREARLAERAGITWARQPGSRARNVVTWQLTDAGRILARKLSEAARERAVRVPTWAGEAY